MFFSSILDVGCPVLVKNEVPFRPTLHLYDYDTFVKTVEADFIIWEVNGRVDYAYTHHVEEMLCLRTAQSWNERR